MARWACFLLLPTQSGPGRAFTLAGARWGLYPQHLVSSLTQPTQSGLLHLVSLYSGAAEATQGCINPH